MKTLDTPTELMLLEFINETEALKHRHRETLNKYPDYLKILTRKQVVARKLLHGYRNQLICEDIVISALDGIIHFVARVRENLEEIEKKQRKRKIKISWKRIIDILPFLAKSLK